MTYTRHGHHIPGSSDTEDEMANAPAKHRCGGCGLCHICSAEAQIWVSQNKFEQQRDTRGHPISDGLSSAGHQARELVYNYVKDHLGKTDDTPFYISDVHVVWFCKTLQNWKALVSTNLPDGMYYEVTYNGNERVAYLDAYKKFNNISIPMDGK